MELNFVFLPPSLRKQESRVALGTKTPQFSFPACAQERLARFKLPFRRWLRFFAHKNLEPKKTDKDEQKEQFEDIENPSAEEILKLIKECYGEAVGKAFEGKNLAYIFSAGNSPECYKPSLFLSFLLFFYFLACFYLTTTICGTFIGEDLDNIKLTFPSKYKIYLFIRSSPTLPTY